MFHNHLFFIYIQEYNKKHTKNYKINVKNKKCIYCGYDEWSDLCTCS